MHEQRKKNLGFPKRSARNPEIGPVMIAPTLKAVNTEARKNVVWSRDLM
jgi:hypothetical protein